jgi:cyclic pyranopterin phosphate synthase
LLEGSQVQSNPQAFTVRGRISPHIKQVNLGWRITDDVGVVDKKLHVVIITRNRFSHRWYNSVMPTKLTHIDDSGHAHMVDVGDKPETERLAIAQGEVMMKKETLGLIRAGAIKKGDVLTVAQIAGIAAAKRTSDLIPLCHPLPITHIDVSLTLDDNIPGVHIKATVKTTGKTGVEMEALTAVAVAALTIYDMAKAAEKTMKIQNIRLTEKHGGRSGDVVNL